MPTGDKKAVEIATLALDKKASSVVVLDMRGLLSFADYFVICSGKSTTQVETIVDNIIAGLSKKRVKPLSVEGRKGGRWVLLDFGDVITHVFDEETREFYELEKLWLDAPRVEVQEKPEETKRPRRTVKQ